MPAINRWIWNRDDFPNPLHADDDVDGVLLITRDQGGHDTIPFGEAFPEDGAEPRPYGAWSWDGDRAKPTLKPSIDLGDYHVHVRDGELVEAGGDA